VKTIGHILPFTAVGGTEHATVRIAASVDASMLRSVVFYVAGCEVVREFIQRNGFAAIPYDPPIPSYRYGVRFVRSSWRLAKLLREHNVDVVHCSDLLAAHYAAFAGKLARLPVICHIRARFDVISRRDCSFLWPVNSFVFVSSDTLEHFRCATGRRRGSVVYDGIDVDENKNAQEDRRRVREEFGIADNAPVAGMIARIAPVKDYLTLARSARRILDEQPDARFLVVGDYASPGAREHYESVVAWLRENKVEDAFIFTGHRRDITRILNAIDVFVLSTHLEGLPLVILEAMAQRKPVVATAVGGVPELVINGETGLLVAHQDPEALARNVVRLMRDPALAKRLSDGASVLIETRFSRQQFSDGMNAVYARALGL